MKQANLIIYVSNDGGANWTALALTDVPDWLKDPDVMRKLIEGEMAQQRPDGLVLPDDVRPWYRAEPAGYDRDVMAIRAAAEKRARRAQRNVVLH
jgi:hypothetical protein